MSIWSNFSLLNLQPEPASETAQDTSGFDTFSRQPAGLRGVDSFGARGAGNGTRCSATM